MINHNSQNFGQAPMFQTTGQMTESVTTPSYQYDGMDEPYPTAASLHAGLERVDRLMAPTPAMDRWEQTRY